MLYIEYEDYKTKYHDAQDTYNEILDEKELIFQRTQPKSTMGEYEREFDRSFNVGASGGSRVNQIEVYVTQMEQKQIDERLAGAKKILDGRKSLLQHKEQELRESRKVENRIYVLRYLDGMRINKIASVVGYSEPQVYRILKKIRIRIKHDRK